MCVPGGGTIVLSLCTLLFHREASWLTGTLPKVTAVQDCPLGYK
jgi:hypothetical protein